MNDEIRKLQEKIGGKEIVTRRDVLCVCGYLIERGYPCYKFKRGEYMCVRCRDSFEYNSPDNKYD